MRVVTAILLSLALTGCATKVVVQKEIVTVERPVPFVPPPPVVPKYDSQVEKLTDADVADPGKVVQAYKYDITALRGSVAIYESILDQYKASSQNFDQINIQIKQLFDQLNKAEQNAVEKQKSGS